MCPVGSYLKHFPVLWTTSAIYSVPVNSGTHTYTHSLRRGHMYTHSTYKFSEVKLGFKTVSNTNIVLSVPSHSHIASPVEGEDDCLPKWRVPTNRYKLW
jgi:hypothetical protein